MACQWNLCWFSSIFGKQAVHTLDWTTAHQIKAVNNARSKLDSCFWSLKLETVPPNVFHCVLIHADMMQMCAYETEIIDIYTTWFPYYDYSQNKNWFSFWNILNKRINTYCTSRCNDLWVNVLMWNSASSYLRKSWKIQGRRQGCLSLSSLFTPETNLS